MNCPYCGNMMVWLNGSISHDPPVKHYTCKQCMINVSVEDDGNTTIEKLK